MSKEVNTNQCAICDAEGPDMRFLKMRCFYAIDELVPEMQIDANRKFFECWICKACRGSLLDKMKEWRDERVKLRDVPKDSDGHVKDDMADPTRNIPVRINGRIVMMNVAEFRKHQGLIDQRDR